MKLHFLVVALAVACTGTSEPIDDEPKPDEEPPALRMVLYGGGDEDPAVFQRFLEASSFGSIVIVGSKPEDDPYLTYWEDFFVGIGAASATTVNTTSREDASNPEFVAAVEQADGLFLRGGDQSRYVEQWTDTPLHAALTEAWTRGAVVAGSSAGCAVLGEQAYDARVGGVAAWEALLDPFDDTITFSQGFWPDALPGILTDTHFTERGRLGRLPVFLARQRDAGTDVTRGIGVDPQTALLVYEDLSAEVVGAGSVTLVDVTESQVSLEAGVSPALQDVRVWQLPAGYEVDLTQWKETGDPIRHRPEWALPVEPAADSLGSFPDITVDGDNLAQRVMGTWNLQPLDEPEDAWRQGLLEIVSGEDVVPGTLLLTGLYERSAVYENHFGGITWALSQQAGLVAVALDTETTPVRLAAPTDIIPTEDSFALIFDGRSVTHAGTPDDGGWQRAALENLSLHVATSSVPWSGTP